MRGRDKCRRWLLCHAEYPHDINWDGPNSRWGQGSARIYTVGLGQGGKPRARADQVAAAILTVVEELEIGADRIERHSIAVGASVEHASASVTDRLQTEKLVPQPQAAVAFGFLILNDALIRSST